MRFNLAIEVLLISSPPTDDTLIERIQFQSRNRGSFGFK